MSCSSTQTELEEEEGVLAFKVAIAWTLARLSLSQDMSFLTFILPIISPHSSEGGGELARGCVEAWLLADVSLSQYYRIIHHL